MQTPEGLSLGPGCFVTGYFNEINAQFLQLNRKLTNDCRKYFTHFFSLKLSLWQFDVQNM